VCFCVGIESHEHEVHVVLYNVQQSLSCLFNNQCICFLCVTTTLSIHVCYLEVTLHVL